MPRTPTTTEQRLIREDAAEEICRLRAEIAASNPDMTDGDWDALADRWAADVDDGLRDRVRRGPEEHG